MLGPAALADKTIAVVIRETALIAWGWRLGFANRPVPIPVAETDGLRDYHVFMGQAVFPRKLDALPDPIHVEHESGRPIHRLVETSTGKIMVRRQQRKLQALQVQRDAHDLVAARLHHRRDLDVVATPELVPEPARQVKADWLLPPFWVFKQLDDLQALDEVLVDDRAINREVAGEAEDRERPQHPALDIVAGQQEE
jgi:hypothetical protein